MESGSWWQTARVCSTAWNAATMGEPTCPADFHPHEGRKAGKRIRLDAADPKAVAAWDRTWGRE